MKRQTAAYAFILVDIRYLIRRCKYEPVGQSKGLPANFTGGLPCIAGLRVTL